MKEKHTTSALTLRLNGKRTNNIPLWCYLTWYTTTIWLGSISRLPISPIFSLCSRQDPLRQRPTWYSKVDEAPQKYANRPRILTNRFITVVVHFPLPWSVYWYIIPLAVSMAPPTKPLQAGIRCPNLERPSFSSWAFANEVRYEEIMICWGRYIHSGDYFV